MLIVWKNIAAVCAVGVLLLPLKIAHAKTITLAGAMKTQLDYSRTYSIDIGDPLTRLTLNIPVPQSGSLLGYAETATPPLVESSIPPISETDIVDRYGNVLHVMEYKNLERGTLIVHVTVKDDSLAADLDVPLPSWPLPLEAVDGDAAACLQPTENAQSDSEEIRSLAAKITAGATDEATAARAISVWMLNNIPYDTDGLTVRTSALKALADRTARCDGLASLFIALARASGIPARYVAGCWVTPKVSYTSKAASAPKSAADHTHAWVELWFPGAGWIPYEPQQTAGFVDTHHLRELQIPDGGAAVKTMIFAGTGASRPDVKFKLTYAFDNIVDTFTYTEGDPVDDSGEKNLYTRK